MYIKTSYLKQLLYNVLLWTPGKGEAKKFASQGLVKMVVVSEGPPVFLSTDGYVAVSSGHMEPDPRSRLDREEWYFKGEDLKEALRNLPADVQEIELTQTDGEDPSYFFGKQELKGQVPSEREFWKAVEDIVFSTDYFDVDLEVFRDFYLDPRRLQKFSLLEPRMEFPLAFGCRLTKFDQPVLIWKYGPDVHGVFSPLQVDAIYEAYPDNIDEVMW